MLEKKLKVNFLGAPRFVTPDVPAAVSSLDTHAIAFEPRGVRRLSLYLSLGPSELNFNGLPTPPEGGV